MTEECLRAIKNLVEEVEYQIHDGFPTPHRLQEANELVRQLLPSNVQNITVLEL